MVVVVRGDHARSGRIKSETAPGQVSDTGISFGHSVFWKLAIINDEKYTCRGRYPHLPDPKCQKAFLCGRCEFRCVRCRLKALCYFSGRRLFLTQSSFTICLARPNASESGGTSSVMQEAAPTYDPLPNFTGATKVESLPTNTPSSITVLCLRTPS